jgi:hypothetical protein
MVFATARDGAARGALCEVIIENPNVLSFLARYGTPLRGSLSPRAQKNNESIAGVVMFGYLMARGWPTMG